MTDYLYTVKKLVERLDLHSSEGAGSVRGNKNKPEVNIIGNHSDKEISGQQDEVRYRHWRNVTNKDMGDVIKQRKKSRADMSDTMQRRQSMSLYQLIKQNKEKLSGKHDTICQLNSSPSSSPSSFVSHSKQRTIFEFNVYGTNETCKDSGECDSNSKFCHRRSHRLSKDLTSGSLLSPATPHILEPCSPNKSQSSFNRNFTSNESEFQNQELKSPLPPSPVFTEIERTSDRRKGRDKKCRQRLSASKSMPLSPPVSNPERSAQQFGDFQLKLDTLRAELLAMRKADQELAKKLLNLYSEIRVLKVKSSCMNFGDLLDEAMYEAEMADELPDMCDAPQKFTNKLLTSHGVTSFNIHSRRFSCS